MTNVESFESVNGRRMVTVRNPWGHPNKNAVEFPQDHADIFKMEWDQFCDTFVALGIAKHGTNGGWHRQVRKVEVTSSKKITEPRCAFRIKLRDLQQTNIMVGIYQDDVDTPEYRGYDDPKNAPVRKAGNWPDYRDIGFTILRYPYNSRGELMREHIKPVMEAPSTSVHPAVFSERRGGFGELFVKPHNGLQGKDRVTYEYYVVPMSFFGKRGQEFNLVVFSDRDNLDVSAHTDCSTILKQNPQMRALGAIELMLRKEQLLTDYWANSVLSTGLFYDLQETISGQLFLWWCAALRWCFLHSKVHW